MARKTPPEHSHSSPGDGGGKISPDELGMPKYDDVSNAPQVQGHIVYATGDGASAEGLYKHDGTSYSQPSGGASDPHGNDAHSPSMSEVPMAKDGNSPQTSAGVTSDTYTLSGTYDYVQAIVQIEDVSSSVNIIDLQVDGDTGSNYDYMVQNGTEKTGTTQVDRVLGLGADQTRTAHIYFDGRHSSSLSGGVLPKTSSTSQATGWKNTNASSPLNSITLAGDGNFDVSWTVYGMDVDAGGEP